MTTEATAGLRGRNIEKLARGVYDVLVIGGGINGAVSAAALSGKGASVALIDQRDFAGFTSQNSSNLAWGGIKYFESGDFPLVRKLCLSRNHLLDNYPSRVKEIRFFTTIGRGFRFRPWFLWLGTWVYWLFGNGFTAAPRLLGIDRIEQEEPVVRTDNV
jgi:glycerol-3-phosphate dehydrogenase